MAQRPAYGGQAVIEGVMILGKSRIATAVRLPDGEITVRREDADPLTQRYRWLRIPFLRGTPALIDSMRMGYRNLMWSADLAMEGEDQPKPTVWQYIYTFAFAFGLAIGLFILLPNWLADLAFPQADGNSHATTFLAQLQQLKPSVEAMLPNLLEGVLRIVMLVLYILVIGKNTEIQRVFAYHGAEHKVVNAWEAGATLSVEGARPHTRIHPRCGTSFLSLFFVVGILVHGLIGWPDDHLIRYASRLLLIIPIAGISYELIRLAGQFQHAWLLRILIWPGLLLQRITTAEPADDQIEVALTAMRTVLEEEGAIEPAPFVPTPEPADVPIA